MAKLEDILPKLKIPPENTIILKNKLSVRKRRPWIEEGEDSKPEETKENILFENNLTPKQSSKKSKIQPSNLFLDQVSEPENKKGSINQVHQSGSSSTFMNHIHEPLNEKGSIKEVYNPYSLSLCDLRGNPLKLIRFFHALAKHENDSNKTRRIKLKEIMQHFDISKDSARTALRFLLKQKLIFRIEFHPGQLGWSRYEIKKTIYEEVEKATSKGSIDPLKIIDCLEVQKGFIDSSSNNINTTTTNINRAGDLPEEWHNIDFQPLEHIGFSQTQLKQLHTINTNTPQVIQESIYQFAFGLENNPKVQSYNDPLNVFMGLLRKGGSWFEKEYISPKVKAEREMLAAMEKELAELKEIEEKKFETAFSIWHLKLSNSDKENILLNYPKIEEGSKFSEMAKMGNLKKYFKEEVYSKN